VNRKNWARAAAANPCQGGLKGSGIGREGPRYAVEEMTEINPIVFPGIE